MASEYFHARLGEEEMLSLQPGNHMLVENRERQPFGKVTFYQHLSLAKDYAIGSYGHSIPFKKASSRVHKVM